MFYVKNVPPGERVLRVVCGAVAAVAGVALLDGAAGWLVAASAAGLVASGLFGFCPACALVGRKLKSD
jgi:hypothetical protein